MLLKELIELIDEDKVENLILYLYNKDKEFSYGIFMMKQEDSVNSIFKKYGDYTIDHFSIVSSRKHRAAYDFVGPGYEVLDVTISDCITPDREVCDCEVKDNVAKETIKDTINILNNINTINSVPVDQTAVDLMTAATCMNRNRSINDFLEFIYHNGYKIGLTKDK